MKSVLLTITFAMTLIGCTAAVPDVSSLQDIPAFKSDSAGPFAGDTPGSYFTVSGYCLNTVTGFELYLDDLPIPTFIPMGPPSPDPAQGEYLVGAQEYDVDCSDFDFNFYVFHSLAVSNFTANGVTRDDPYKIEIRPVSSVPLPSVIFERPAPVAIEVRPQGGSENTVVFEGGQYIALRITLRDSNDEETRALTADIPFTLTANNITNPNGDTGIFYESNCTTPLNLSSLIFAWENGEREFEVCFRVTSTTDGQLIRIEAESGGLTTKYWEFIGKSNNSATVELKSASASGLPPHLIKGVTYSFDLSLVPVRNDNGRNVSSYSGQLGLATPSVNVQLQGSIGDTYCPTTPVVGSILCGLGNYLNRTVELTIDSSFADKSIELISYASPMSACSSGCTIFDSTTHNISSYAPKTYNIPVVTGDTTYLYPFMDPKINGGPDDDGMIRLGECTEGLIGSSNTQGYVFPESSSKSFVLSSHGLLVKYYSTFTDCTSDAYDSQTKSFSVPAGIAGARFYYKYASDEMPVDGQVKFLITDPSNTTYQREAYLKSN